MHPVVISDVYSIAVVSDICGLGVTGSASSIGTLSGIAVGLDSCLEGLLPGGKILRLALPRLQGGGLQGTAIGERKGPWASDGCNLVHLIQIQGCLLLGLAAGQEHDSAHGRGDGPGQGPHSVPGDLLG